MEVVITNYISNAARWIREEVFIKEQGFQEEFDEVDSYADCVVLYENDIPMACGRCFPGERVGEYVAGRVAVRQEYRGRHLGSRVLEEIEKNVREKGGTSVSLSAQLQAVPFYEKQGYRKSGGIYYDEHCQHIHMEKTLTD